MNNVARITGVSMRRVDMPLEIPVITPMHTITSTTCLLVAGTADNGIEVQGFAFCFGRDRLLVIEAMVKAINAQIIGVNAREPEGLWEMGFKAVKLRLGDLPLSQNIERVEAVRGAIGPDIGLMVDVNQGLDVDHALALGREQERFDLFRVRKAGRNLGPSRPRTDRCGDQHTRCKRRDSVPSFRHRQHD